MSLLKCKIFFKFLSVTGGIRLFMDVTMMGTKEKVYDKFLDTTELLVDGSSHWRFAGKLPTSRWGLRGVSVNNRIIIAGSWNWKFYQPFNLVDHPSASEQEAIELCLFL